VKKKQLGFTLIELVIVIILLGLLAVVAVPKFIDLSTDARTSTTRAVAGSLSAANSINYASRKANSAKGSAVANCTDASALLSGGLPTGYTITAATAAVDAQATCTLTGPGSITATFNVTGIS